MSNNLFSTQNVVMATLLSCMAWGAVSINNLQAVTAVNSDRSDKLDTIIPKMGESLSNIESDIGVMTNDIGYVKQDIVEIKLSQKDYQKDFNARLDGLR